MAPAISLASSRSTTIPDRAGAALGCSWHEIKSLLDHPGFHKEVNKKALRPYMTLQYSAMNETFFEGAYKLPPAH